MLYPDDGATFIGAEQELEDGHQDQQLQGYGVYASVVTILYPYQ